MEKRERLQPAYSGNFDVQSVRRASYEGSSLAGLCFFGSMGRLRGEPLRACDKAPAQGVITHKMPFANFEAACSTRNLDSATRVAPNHKLSKEVDMQSK